VTVGAQLSGEQAIRPLAMRAPEARASMFHIVRNLSGSTGRTTRVSSRRGTRRTTARERPLETAVTGSDDDITDTQLTTPHIGFPKSSFGDQKVKMQYFNKMFIDFSLSWKKINKNHEKSIKNQQKQ